MHTFISCGRKRAFQIVAVLEKIQETLSSQKTLSLLAMKLTRLWMETLRKLVKHMSMTVERLPEMIGMPQNH